MKSKVLIALALAFLAGCNTVPMFSDGTKTSMVADRCDPRGACNVGKHP